MRAAIFEKVRQDCRTKSKHFILHSARTYNLNVAVRLLPCNLQRINSESITVTRVTQNEIKKPNKAILNQYLHLDFQKQPKFVKEAPPTAL